MTAVTAVLKVSLGWRGELGLDLAPFKLVESILLFYVVVRQQSSKLDVVKINLRCLLLPQQDLEILLLIN
jgi:hypothetical protein